MAWHGQAAHANESDETFRLVEADRDRAMVRAVRNGLAEHPLVAEWVRMQTLLGDRKVLRKARVGAEKGVKRPYTEDEMKLDSTIRDLLRTYEQEYRRPCTQARARKRLINDKTIPRMTPQGFHKLLERLDLLHLFPERRS